MFKLDNAFLEEQGLGSLPVDEKNKLLQHIYETLEMRVGMRLAENMTDAQLDEFESFIDRNDEPGALAWLEQNFPNYRDVVAQELERLKQEIRTNAANILATSGAGGVPNGSPAMNPGGLGNLPSGMPGSLSSTTQSMSQPSDQAFGQPSGQPFDQPTSQSSSRPDPLGGYQPDANPYPTAPAMPADPYSSAAGATDSQTTDPFAPAVGGPSDPFAASTLPADQSAQPGGSPQPGFSPPSDPYSTVMDDRPAPPAFGQSVSQPPNPTPTPEDFNQIYGPQPSYQQSQQPDQPSSQAPTMPPQPSMDPYKMQPQGSTDPYQPTPSAPQPSFDPYQGTTANDNQPQAGNEPSPTVQAWQYPQGDNTSGSGQPPAGPSAPPEASPVEPWQPTSAGTPDTSSQDT